MIGQSNKSCSARIFPILVSLLAIVLFSLAVSSLLRSDRAAAQDLDINAIMPCGADFTGKQSADQCASARNLFMQNCTSCHSFVPVVLEQKDDGGWAATINKHKSRVSDMSPADLSLVQQFLADHFRPDRPVPKLPQELIDNDPGFPPA